MARDVKVAILGDARDFKRAMGDAGDAAHRGFSRIGGIAAGAGKAVALGLAGAVAGAGLFAKSAIDAGSDLQETLSKSNTVFGTQAKAVENWSKSMAGSFGQSQQQALEAAGSFGNMFSQLGVGDKQAADMSRSMTELASDFASFHNADISEVLTAQQAAFRGEYDAVQKFVPTINAAAVEQKALKMGLAKTTKELTPQNKALAVQALLMEGAGDAAGDFSRTSKGLANQQRILSARFQDVKAKIGTALIPIALKLADLFSKYVLPAFKEVGDGVTAFMAAFQDAEGGITSSGLAGYLEGFGITVRGMFDAVKAKVQEWWPAIKSAFQSFMEFVRAVVAVVRDHWPQIQAIIQQVLATVSAYIKGFVDVVTTLWDNFGNNILEFVRRVWPNIQQIIKAAMDIIQGIIKTVTALIHGDWKMVWEGIKQTLSGVWNGIQGIVKYALEVLRFYIGAGLEIIGSLWKDAWNKLVAGVYGLGGRISNAASGMWDGIVRGFKAAINTVIRLWNNFEIKFNGYDIPGPGPNIPSFRISTKDIPYLAEGGIVRRPTLAMVGERGPEAVVPLDRMRQQQPQTIVVQIGDEVLARVIANGTATGARRGIG